jgi:hypothetical protein
LNSEFTEGVVFRILRKKVNERYQDILKHKEKLTIDRWNLSNFFYPTRLDLENEGYDTTPLNDAKSDWRRRIYAQVRVICEKELGIKRHDAGIFPADRAVMAFQGKLYSISYDSIEYLKKNGPDVILIEKEGIVEKLVPFTTELGIALIHSQGFYSEYAEMLANEVNAWGGNVGILTDFDSSGINMGLKIRGPTHKEKVHVQVGDTDIKVQQALYKNTPKRLGIDFETVQYLGLSIADLQENALNKKGLPSSHWVGLHNTLQGKRKRDNENEWTLEQFRSYFPYLKQECTVYNNEDGQEYLSTYIDFLKRWRIELDTVVNIVGPQRFWAWLKQKILKTFETRDYNRAIAVPRYVPTPTMEVEGKLWS